MNLPNRLTMARLILTAGFVVAMESGWPFSVSVAWLLFVVASVTDYLDGKIARERKLITDFGKLMDPVADKILTAAAFICLASAKSIPSWAVILIVSREFLITALRSLAAAKGKILPAERLGKHKTAWQIATIIFFLSYGVLQEWIPFEITSHATIHLLFSITGSILIWVTVVLTVASGVAYMWKNRGLMSDA